MKASLLSRVIASLLDGLFLGLLNFLITVIIVFSGDNKQKILLEAKTLGADRLPQTYSILWACVLISILLMLIYASMEIMFFRTPGKMIMGIEIRGEDGEQASLPALFMRWIFKHLGTHTYLIALLFLSHSLISLAGLAGFIMSIGCLMALGEKKQTLYDKIACTCVFVRQGPSYHERDEHTGRFENSTGNTTQTPRKSSGAVDKLIFD
ncbi:MAG: RDD family protein [Deltaproteobacteria bacterium]|nr:RDD family protein [Deltaproteobacteria bacterium]